MSYLYIVATPIGNLSDFSFRSTEILKTVHAVACEDTRISSRLLQHYGIKTTLLSFHQHNEHQKVQDLMQLLDSGKDIALISDAGTPGISDPGFLAARAAHQKGHHVVAVPGPSAATTALTASGLPSDRFLFEGFLPPRKGRSARLDMIADQDCTVILYESVHRIEKLVDELSARCEPQRLVAVCRELTKQFEETIRGPLSEVTEKIHNHAMLKGEFVVIISGKNYKE